MRATGVTGRAGFYFYCFCCACVRAGPPLIRISIGHRPRSLCLRRLGAYTYKFHSFVRLVGTVFEEGTSSEEKPHIVLLY
jgi:hypothetical protein